MTRSTLSLDRMRALAGSIGHVTLALCDYTKVSDTLAKVVLTASKPIERAARKDITYALNHSLPGTTPIVASFREVVGALTPSIVGFVAVVPNVRMQDDPSFSRMRNVTASLMLDPEDSTMWDIKTTQEGATMLVQRGKEDLSSLLQTASVRNVSAPRIKALAGYSSRGEYVAYACAKTNTLRYGFVLASNGEDVEVVGEDGESDVIKESEVVEAAILDKEEFNEVLASTGIKVVANPSKADLLSYYEQVYAYAPAYLEDIKRMINTHALA